MYKMWNRSERDLRTTKYVLCTTPQYTLKQVRNREGQKQIRNMSVRHETSSTVPKQPLRCKNNWTTTFMFDPCHSWNVQCSARSNLRDLERNVGLKRHETSGSMHGPIAGEQNLRFATSSTMCRTACNIKKKSNHYIRHPVTKKVWTWPKRANVLRTTKNTFYIEVLLEGWLGDRKI